MLGQKQKGSLCIYRRDKIVPGDSWFKVKVTDNRIHESGNRFSTFYCILCFLFCLLILAGCATTTDLENVNNRLTSLQIEASTQKKEIAEIKNGLSEAQRDIAALKERTEGVVKEYTLNAIRESQSSLLSQTSELLREIQSLKGRFDESKYFIDRTLKELLSEREVLQARIAMLEGELKDIKTKILSQTANIEKKEQPVEASKEPDPPEKRQNDAMAIDPQRLYDEAYIDFKEKRYDSAEQKLDNFIKKFPDHALTANAYFLIAESQYAQKRYDDAILSYEAFLKKYPAHEKTRVAILKQAYAFIEMGDKKTGKVLLEKVIERYPSSTESELAKKKIQEISPGPVSQPKKKR